MTIPKIDTMSTLKARLVLLSVLLFSCATPAVFSVNSELLVPWSREAQDGFPDLPYSARYEKENKRLTYIASTHEHKIPNAVFALVEHEFKTLKPQVIIIEGIGSAAGFSPQSFMKSFPDSLDSEFWEGGEAMYAAYIAHINDVPFIGAEASPADIMEQMRGNEYTVKDLVYYFVVRQIGQWRRTENYESQSFEPLFSGFIEMLARVLELDSASLDDVAKFKTWYLNKNKKKFDYHSVTSEETAPIHADDALYTQKMSCLNDRIRNVHTVGVIADMLNQFDRVLIVYGAGHHLQQEKILLKMMGEPVFEDAHW